MIILGRSAALSDKDILEKMLVELENIRDSLQSIEEEVVSHHEFLIDKLSSIENMSAELKRIENKLQNVKQDMNSKHDLLIHKLSVIESLSDKTKQIIEYIIGGDTLQNLM